MPKKIEVGDNYNIKCPHCSRRIHYPVKEELPITRIIQFSKPCPYCAKLVHYEAKWEMKLKASNERVN